MSTETPEPPEPEASPTAEQSPAEPVDEAAEAARAHMARLMVGTDAVNRERAGDIPENPVAAALTEAGRPAARRDAIEAGLASGRVVDLAARRGGRRDAS